MNPFMIDIIGRIEHAMYTQSVAIDCSTIVVEQVALDLGMSRHKLQRLFKAEMGVDISSYIQKLRMETAANFLCLTGRSIEDVALGLGYSCQQAFTRAFSRHFGMSPAKMREQAKEEHAPLLAGTIPQIPVRVEKLSRPMKLWYVRYTIGSYEHVLEHWNQFGRCLAELGLSSDGPYFGLIFDDPDIAQPGQIRYGCGIFPRDRRSLPPGWLEIELMPSRFVVFSLHCTHAESVVRLRPAVLSWFRASQETFGVSGAFEQYGELPTGGAEVVRDFQLFVSLAN